MTGVFDTGKKTILMFFKLDRTQLSTPCVAENETFVARYGINHTRYNRLSAATHYQFQNCSSAVFMGFKQGKD